MKNITIYVCLIGFVIIIFTMGFAFPCFVIQKKQGKAIVSSAFGLDFSIFTKNLPNHQFVQGDLF